MTVSWDVHNLNQSANGNLSSSQLPVNTAQKAANDGSVASESANLGSWIKPGASLAMKGSTGKNQ